MVGRSLMRWALRMALIYALKKGIELATRTPVQRRSRPRTPSAHLTH